MAETLTNFFKEHGIAPELIIFIISLLPILELRGGLIAAAILHIPFYISLPICIIGNLLPIPIVLLFTRKIFDFLKRFKTFKRIVEALESSTLKKGKRIQNSTILGLILFVGIPIPGTGAWTGAMAADLFNMRLKHSIPAIALGVLLASAIMLIITYLIPGVFGF